MKNLNLFKLIAFLFLLTTFSCSEEELGKFQDNVSYVVFEKNILTDTMTVSFKFYNEGEMPEIAVPVDVYGKVNKDDLVFHVSVDEQNTTLPSSQFILPESCKIKKGQLKDTILIKLKNYPELKTNTKYLVVKIDDGKGVRAGETSRARLAIAVTDRLFKPEWWSVNNSGYAEYFINTAEAYYLGSYSETKYMMFLEELKKDKVVFDGKDLSVLRKYSLRLKNTIENINSTRPEDDPLCDENGLPLVVPIAG